MNNLPILVKRFYGEVKDSYCAMKCSSLRTDFFGDFPDHLIVFVNEAVFRESYPQAPEWDQLDTAEWAQY